MYESVNHSVSPPQQVLTEMTDGGLDYTFECVGNIHTMVFGLLFSISFRYSICSQNRFFLRHQLNLEVMQTSRHIPNI